MPAKALLTATLEQAINRLLALDEDSATRLRGLKGSRLTVFVSPLTYGITLVFSDQVDVIAEEAGFAELAAQAAEEKTACCLSTSLPVLSSLRQTGNITHLIQQNKLEVEGNLQVAQQASALFQQLDIDWEDHLADVIGDVPANQLFRSLNQVHQQVRAFAGRMMNGVANAVVEEKQLAAHRLAVMHYSDEVNRLRDDAARLEARLTNLEGSQ